jgi:hypothetical protein
MRRTKEDIRNEVEELRADILEFKMKFERLTPRTKKELVSLVGSNMGFGDPILIMNVSLAEWLEGIRI